MGHHINKEGQFQSDKYPDLKPDKIVLSFHDKVAREALRVYCLLTEDTELKYDIRQRLLSLGMDVVKQEPEEEEYK